MSSTSTQVPNRFVPAAFFGMILGLVLHCVRHSTLGIQLAPPTVGCSAYLSITSGPPDLIAQMLLGYGVFQALLLIRLLPWIVQQPFAPSYWAFTFGLSAIAASFVRTLWLLQRGRLLPAPLLPPPETLQAASRVL